MEGKKTRGRQKVELKKIEKEESLNSTFSKRKSGIYKQANEIVACCGAQVGVLIFSPAGKPFSYAHPSIESVNNRFMNMNMNPNPTLEENSIREPLTESREKVIDELNRTHNEKVLQLSIEKEQAKELERVGKKQNHCRPWWETTLMELDYEEASKSEAISFSLHSAALNTLKGKISGASSSAAANFTNPVDIGCSGNAPFIPIDNKEA